MATEITISFYTNEEVTPELFAMKVAQACARFGAVRVGERIAVNGFLWEFIGMIDSPVVGSSPVFANLHS